MLPAEAWARSEIGEMTARCAKEGPVSWLWVPFFTTVKKGLNGGDRSMGLGFIPILGIGGTDQGDWVSYLYLALMLLCSLFERPTTTSAKVANIWANEDSLRPSYHTPMHPL